MSEDRIKDVHDPYCRKKDATEDARSNSDKDSREMGGTYSESHPRDRPYTPPGNWQMLKEGRMTPPQVAALHELTDAMIMGASAKAAMAEAAIAHREVEEDIARYGEEKALGHLWANLGFWYFTNKLGDVTWDEAVQNFLSSLKR